METMHLADLQLDALREVANIASGHAATALGQLTSRRIMIAVPECTLTRADDVPQLLGYSRERVVVVAMHILGDLTGALAFLIPVPKAARLSGILLQREVEQTALPDDMARSALTETANILGGAYAGALGALMGCIVMVSVPSLGIEPPDGVLSRLRQSDAHDHVGLCIETKLTCEGELTDFGGHMLLFPTPVSLGVILDALRVKN
jgi:chemotaxis protein CheC